MGREHRKHQFLLKLVSTLVLLHNTQMVALKGYGTIEGWLKMQILAAIFFPLERLHVLQYYIYKSTRSLKQRFVFSPVQLHQ